LALINGEIKLFESLIKYDYTKDVQRLALRVALIINLPTRQKLAVGFRSRLFYPYKKEVNAE